MNADPRVNNEHTQSGNRLRLDWGSSGASAIASAVDIAVVVDVLSFTTTLSVAMDAGIVVLPYRFRDENARAYAAEHDAVLAVGRSQASAGSISLSPGTIRASLPPARLVLPSPNGSRISYELASTAKVCVGASLRNYRSVAEWVLQTHGPQATVAVVAAGERWPDGELRPAIEDLWGSGAVIDTLLELGWTSPSPEAEVAAAAWAAARTTISTALHDCASGRELVAAGFSQDVEIAAEVDSSGCVPVLVGDRYIDRRTDPIDR